MAAKKELGTSDLLVPDRFLLLKLLEPPLKKRHHLGTKHLAFDFVGDITCVNHNSRGRVSKQIDFRQAVQGFQHGETKLTVSGQGRADTQSDTNLATYSEHLSDVSLAF